MILIVIPQNSYRQKYRLVAKQMKKYLISAAGIMSAVGYWVWRRWHIPMQQHPDLVLDSPVGAPFKIQRGYAPGGHALQDITVGTGPIFQRHYYIDIEEPTVDREALMARIQANLDDFAPRELARFEKTGGNENRLSVDDEFYIHITGPWDGPVCTIDVTSTSFSFATLEDHLEAGAIKFAIVDLPDKTKKGYRFEIISCARSRDGLVALAYDKLKIAKAAQTSLWVYFCNRVLEESGGHAGCDVQVLTYKAPYDEYAVDETRPTWEQYSQRLETFRQAGANFDIRQDVNYDELTGWRIDDYEIDLPSEPPGQPLPGGSWETARDVMMNYEFPDPAIIEGIFVPDDPLQDRVMVLIGKFLFLKFYFGVRVSRVVDTTRADEARGEAKVWGYSYHTLEGHFEMGEITFEVWKFLETGDVEFRIHSYSKTGHIPNIFYRIGFKLFGRRIQLRFAQTALTRMRQLVLDRMHIVPGDEIETPEVEPVSTDKTAEEKYEEAKSNPSTI